MVYITNRIINSNEKNSLYIHDAIILLLMTLLMVMVMPVIMTQKKQSIKHKEENENAKNRIFINFRVIKKNKTPKCPKLIFCLLFSVFYQQETS